MLKSLSNFARTSYQKRLSQIASLFASDQNFKELGPMGNALGLLVGLRTEFILVGGVARSLYSSTRNTFDIDILFRSEEDIEKFKAESKFFAKPIRGRNHAVKIGYVEIDLLSPEFLKIPLPIIDYVFSHLETSKEGLKVANPEGLILLKSLRMSTTDQDDINALVQSKGSNLDVPSIMSLLSGEAKSIIEKILKANSMFMEGEDG